MKNEDKKYYRKEIVNFQLEDLKILCLSFKGQNGNGFYADYLTDFLKVTPLFDFDTFRSILMKETIEVEDMAKLIQLFNSDFTLEYAIEVVNNDGFYKWIDFNQLYFSIE